MGSEPFVTETKEKLGVEGKRLELMSADGSYELRLSPAPYKVILGHENGGLRLEIEYFWNAQDGCF